MADSDPSTEFSVVVVSPDEVLFEDSAIKIMAPGIEQEIAILPDHTPLYAELIKGTIVITKTDESEKEFPIESAILRVKQNRVSIILGFKP